MKKKFTSLLASIGILLMGLTTTSCIGGQSNPIIGIDLFAINQNILTEGQADVTVGDTLYLGLYMNGYEFDLEYLQLNLDREYFKDSIIFYANSLNSFDQVFTKFSLPYKGYYEFQKGIKGEDFLWAIIPQKARANESAVNDSIAKEPFLAQMIIKSVAKADEFFNPNSIGFKFYVSDKKTVTDNTTQP